jgi:lipopolysaccharide transport system ATP-binding protein
MSRPVIEVEGLSKEFIIGGGERSGETLREVLTSSLAAPFRRLRRIGGNVAPEERIWALKDLTFTINEGEVVGIIGRNGAGKSTLLKILSRITAPTKGRIAIRGRIGSLLEVGTGFHPELSGRENIFLNGALLGMKKKEIERKFDEIVDFSGVEKFIDTPVKRYSSGMSVRLAFAVAAHLDPEILLVDEVLAVGDAEFQRKCLGKMGDVAKSGRTVLFVSHNLGAVNKLCPRSIWIHKGQLCGFKSSAVVIDEYLQDDNRRLEEPASNFNEDPAKPFQLTMARMVDEQGELQKLFVCDRSAILECECVVRETVEGLYGYLSVSRVDGTLVMVSDSYDVSPNQMENLAPGRYRFRIVIPPRSLAPGDYFAYLNFTSPRSRTGWNVDSPGTVARFRLDDYTTRRGNNRDGYFSARLEWSFVPNQQTSRAS